MTKFWRRSSVENRELKQRRRQRQRKHHLKIYLYFILCYFTIISTRSTFTKMANYPGTKLVVVQATEEKHETFTVVRSLSPENLKCGHSTLLFCRGRQRNVPKCKTHVQGDCFYSLNLLFCGVVVAVAVVVA